MESERLRPPLAELFVCSSDERDFDDNFSGLIECTAGRLSLTDVSYSYGLVLTGKDFGRGAALVSSLTGNGARGILVTSVLLSFRQRVAATATGVAFVTW